MEIYMYPHNNKKDKQKYYMDIECYKVNIIKENSKKIRNYDTI